MESKTCVASRESRCLEEAVNWRLLGLLLERPRPGWLEEVRSLATLVKNDRLLWAAQAADQASEGAYLRLFGEGGFVSPRESTYFPMEDPGQILGRIAMCYQSFSFFPRREDPIDHIAVEAGFVGYLWLKEAAALASEDGEKAQIVSNARPLFMVSHLGRFMEPWSGRVMDSGVGYLCAASEALSDLASSIVGEAAPGPEPNGRAHGDSGGGPNPPVRPMIETAGE